jgi:hypothetical protein
MRKAYACGLCSDRRRREENEPSKREEAMEKEQWPSLPYEDWKDTYATLHMWSQIVGKIRLVQMPWINHSWHVTLYMTARGLTTSTIPYGSRSFQIDFDFIDHRLLIQTSDGAVRTVGLRAFSVAEFYGELFGHLADLGLDVRISARPNEVAEPVPFALDREHASYDPEYANRWWRILLQTARVFGDFRADFLGKCSPVHFFWGAFDLAVTRFSGRPAPPHPGGFPNMPDWITREAYSHEVSSCGFWPGGGPVAYPVYYSYAYPAPEGFMDASVRPEAAFYSSELQEFLLPYETVRLSESPEKELREFLRSTYEAAAALGDWDRSALERTKDPRSLA